MGGEGVQVAEQNEEGARTQVAARQELEAARKRIDELVLEVEAAQHLAAKVGSLPLHLPGPGRAKVPQL